MGTHTPHYELLNTYNLNNHTGDELGFERGLELCGWRLPKGKGCGRVWVSGGLIRRKLSEKILPHPTPQLTVYYSFTMNAFRLTPRCILCFRVWSQAEWFCNWIWDCTFTQRNHTDHLLGSWEEDICSYTLAFDSRVSRYSMAISSNWNTIKSVNLDVCRSLCFWPKLFCSR